MMKNRISKYLVFLGLAAALGCGNSNDKDANNNGTTSGTSNQTATDMGADDQGGGSDLLGTDASIVAFGGCPDGITTDTTFDIDSGTAGQFYARVAWDGFGAWVIYNRRESTEMGAPEEIFAARVGCHGDVEVGPLRLSAAGGARNYSPVVASRGGVTQVAWVEDVDGATKTIFLARLGTEGDLLGPVTDITPVDGTGAPISTLTWEPDIAVAEDGSGIVAVSAGLDQSLQIALQRFGTDGTRTGAAFRPYVEAGVDQNRPTVALDADGTTYVAWTRYRAGDDTTGTPEEPETVVMTTIPAGATMALPTSPIPAKPLTSPNPMGRFAREPMPDGAFLFAFQVGADILVRDGSDLQDASSATFGSANFANFRPSVAAGKAGGLLVWYRYDTSPIRGTVMLHPFKYDGTVIPGAEQALPTQADGIPPYGPDATWAGNNAYFVVWAEGTSAPEARVKGRWVVIP